VEVTVDPSKLTEWLKLSPRYLVPIGILLGLLLWAPPFVSGLRLTPFVTQFGPYIGVAFLFVWLLILSAVASPFIPTGDQLKAKLEERAKLRAGQQRLHELTPAEKDLLRPYFQQNTNTQSLWWASGEVQGLVQEDIIAPVLPFARAGMGAPLNIQPWAKRYLSDHPELVDLPPPAAAPDAPRS
jgi:Super-infection exclusion protein B